MHLIDRIAYASPLRSIDPAQKAGFTALVIALCLLLNRPWVGVAAALSVWILSVGLGQVSAGVMRRVVLAEGIFLAASVAGVAVSVRFDPFFIGMTPHGLDSALLLFSRSLGCVLAMNFLALTTPMIDLVDLGHRLRLSPLLLDLMTLIYRFIFTLLESLERIYTAQEARLGYGGFWRSMSSAASLAALLFVDAYRRSARVQVAIEGRGYDGNLRVLRNGYRWNMRLLFCMGATLLLMIFAWSV
ncbi:MAG: cobalt ECF transporter T component CbiQ [Chloroflexi bacterium]|nr:cobalt ECF transporter T component CbiQ [Chloroflexota bacterium]